MLSDFFSGVTEYASRSAGADPEDLWDFGTVRHVARPGTLGKATARTENGLTYPQPVPDLDTNYVPHHNSNGVRPPSMSASSMSSSSSSTITVKGELPPLPGKRVTYQDQNRDQGTVRTTPKRNREGSYDSSHSGSSDESDKERRAEAVRRQMADVHLEDEADAEIDDDDLEERTMLDSVVLPAIASVRPRFNPAGWS